MSPSRAAFPLCDRKVVKDMIRAAVTRGVLARCVTLGAIFWVAAAGAQAEETCQTVLATRIETCARACIARAKAAVAPEIRDRVRGYGCINNCAKLEMFNGNACPDARPKG